MNINEEDHPTYWTQVKVYVYIYGVQNNMAEMDIHLVWRSDTITAKEKVCFQEEVNLSIIMNLKVLRHLM